MGLENTPPCSPQNMMDLENEDNIIFGEDEAFEVIELDDIPDPLGEEDESLEDEEGAQASQSSVQVAIEDNSSMKFNSHGKSVFCVHLRPGDRSTFEAVSGGEDDKAYLWDIKTGAVNFVFDGYKDSVTHVRFNHDGSYLAAADMSGVIRVYKLSSSSIVWEFETADITWMEWHPGTNVLFAGTVESECWMWRIPSGDSKIYMGNGERVECATILPDGKRISVGYGDGSIKIFDLKTGDVQFNSNADNSSAAKQTSAVTCIDSNSGYIGYGSVNGIAKIVAILSGKVVGMFSHANSQAPDNQMDGDEEAVNNSIECISFSKDKVGAQYLYTASLSGEINVWDLSTQVVRHSSILGSGIVKIMSRNKTPSQLFVGTLDGVVIIYDTLAGEVLGACTGHTAAILDIQQSKDGCTLVSSSDDGTARIFDINKILNTSPSS
ncbi:angio-associated migratory cell protein [Lepeophtheirus salmonis]|uniref:angio-associated migratory cell protein n=1 Tax=Lepeophtheirus salmonis TaxID=72036 RepID=UPI001AEABB86|nr:angio-associated migratory cell protein-like [Lepeophtheirus salmonis]